MSTENKDVEIVTQKSLQTQMSFVRNLLEVSKWDKAAELMNNIKNQALIFYNNDELAYGMAEYYFMLGNVLVHRIENMQDLFGDTVKQKEGEYLNAEEQSESDEEGSDEGQEEQQEKQSQQVQDGVIRDEPLKDQQIEEQKNQKQEQVEGDLQIAWENLEIARVILNREYEKEKGTNSDSFKSIVRHLAKVHHRFGELEQWKDSFDIALEEHLKGLELRKQIEDSEISRDLAESYFLIANVILYLAKPGCEKEALDYFKKALQILENNLSLKLKLPKRDVKNILKQKQQKVARIDEQAIFTFHLNASFLDNQEIKELKAIMKLIYEKIEDLKLQINQYSSEEYQKLQQEYEQMKQQKQQNQVFSQPTVQQTQVVNLGTFGNAAKKKLQQDQEVISKQQEIADKITKNQNHYSKNKDDDEKFELSPEKKIKFD